MPTIKPIARWDWTGAEQLDFEFFASKLIRLIELIPITGSLDPAAAQIRVKRLSNILLELRAQFQRYLHQDEFGPSRRDQVEGLRALATAVDKIAEEGASDALDQIADIFDISDTSIISELFDDACRLGLDITRLRKVAPQEKAKKLALLEQALRETINRLSRLKGPTEGTSIPLLISRLAMLWQNETGLEPTASSEKAYRTDFEDFAIAVTTAFLPTKAWFDDRQYLRASSDKNKFAPGKIDSAVRQAVRDNRQTGTSSPGRPRAG